MTANELLYSSLNNTPYTVHALKAPQNAVYPISIYNQINDNYETCADGSKGNLEVLYQIDTYGTDLGVCKAITQSFISALQSDTRFEVVVYDVRDTIEDTGAIYRSMVELKLWI